MTIEECREHIGSGVVYRPSNGGQGQDGVITSVGFLYAFVRYSGDYHAKATNPKQLTLLSGGAK